MSEAGGEDMAEVLRAEEEEAARLEEQAKQDPIQ